MGGFAVHDFATCNVCADRNDNGWLPIWHGKHPDTPPKLLSTKRTAHDLPNPEDVPHASYVTTTKLRSCTCCVGRAISRPVAMLLRYTCTFNNTALRSRCCSPWLTVWRTHSITPDSAPHVRAPRDLMRVVDAFCGSGGWSSGSVSVGCTPILGIDCDEKPLKLWATNCSAGRAACASIGTDAIDWPAAAPDVHVHLSPPCTSLSKARAGAPAQSVAAALDAVRWCVDLVLDKGYTSWSLENVATPAVVACVADLARAHPTRVAYFVVDAADYGVPSNRTRLIASTPAVVRAIKEEPVRRLNVAGAFDAAGLPMPAEFIKSNTTNRNGSPSVRSVRRLHQSRQRSGPDANTRLVAGTTTSLHRDS